MLNLCGQLSCTLNRWKKVNNNDDSLDRFYKYKFFFDKKKKRKLVTKRPSLHIQGMIILVKTVPPAGVN